MATTDVTTILSSAERGDERAADRLLDAVYDELHALAEGRLKREDPGHTLAPTALIHEAYLKLVDQTRVDWQSRTHFKAVATLAMQRILIDHARRKKRQKRGGDWRKLAFDDAFAIREDRHLDAVALHDALEKMRGLDERQVQVVELRIFGGLSTVETADMLNIGTRTVERDWKMGLAWLRRELSEGD